MDNEGLETPPKGLKTTKEIKRRPQEEETAKSATQNMKAKKYRFSLSNHLNITRPKSTMTFRPLKDPKIR